MLGEFFLTFRLLSSLFLSWMTVTLIPFGTMKHSLAGAGVIVLISFVMQYVVFHFLLRLFNPNHGRYLVVLVVMLGAIVVNAWAMYQIGTFSFEGEMKVVQDRFLELVVIHQVAAGAFVGMACTRRAFQKYGAL